MSFSDFALNPNYVSTPKYLQTNSDNRIVNGFIYNDKIVIFYLGNNNKYYIYINNYEFSDPDLDILISDGTLKSGYGIFFKGLHIKEQFMGFIYFKSQNYNSLEIKIGYIESSNTFTTKLTKSFGDYYFYNDDMLNDFIKINDERLAYIGVDKDISNKFKILLFDLYNDYNNMNIRVYDLELSNYKINRELLLNIYNDYLIFSSTVIDKEETSIDNNDARFSILMLFGYVNGTDNTINITDYLKDDYINSNNNLIDKLTEHIEINNNIFQYVILRDQIKLSLIPKEILFYNNENKLLSNDSILSKNYNLIQNINIDKTNNLYSFDYQNIIQEADYDSFDSSAITTISISSSSSENQKNFYQQNYFYGRTNTIKFKLCYEYCATCKEIGIKISDQKCETCLDDYNYYYYNDYTNCVKEGFFIDKQKNQKVKCTNNNSKYYIDKKTGKRICFKYEYDCPPNYPYLNKSTNECCTCTYYELLNKLCSFSDYNNTELYNIIKNYIIHTYPSFNGENLIINGKDNYIFQLTTGENEIDAIIGNKKNEYNLSMIDLNECKSLLKGVNNEKNISLIFLKFEKLTSIVAEKNVQYEIYDSINKTKLDLSICQNSSIDLYFPTLLSEKTQNLYDNLQAQGYDLFNINDSFYSDICTKFKSENGTDVILTDRKNDYYTNETTCQANCQYSNYSSETKYLKCQCEAMSEEIVTVDMDKFNGKMLYENFYEVLKYSNYKVLKCYKLVFNIKVLYKNYGSLFIIISFLFYLSLLCLYIIKGLSPLKINNLKTKLKEKKNIQNNTKKNISNATDINLLKSKRSKEKNILNKGHEKERNNKRCKTHKNNNDKSNNKNKIHNPIKTNPPRKNEFSKSSLIKLNNKKESKNDIQKRNKKIKFKTNIEKNDMGFENNSKGEFKSSNKNMKIKISDKKIKNEINIYNTKKGKKNSSKQKEKLDDYQLNELQYLEAIELDKRPFSQIYWTTLKRNHLILFTFFSWNDYNISYIKFARFIFLVCTDMAMNVFFFTDESMHKIYLNYGKFNFIQQIPQIIYSTALSQLLELFLCYLSLTDKHIYQILELKKKKVKGDIFNILKCIKIKLIAFFSFIFVFFIFYWYLISCFCAVYENTQIIFIKDSVSSFFTSCIYQFVIYLLPSVLRVIALKDKKKNRKCIYKLSDIIPFF